MRPRRPPLRACLRNCRRHRRHRHPCSLRWARGARAFRIDLRVVRPLSAREKLAVRDAVSVLVRLGARVVGAEAGGLGVRGEMWSLSYVVFEVFFLACS
ncbi:hypothetical protein BC826DRAFT_1048442 [Russula brevipes]|nr:hypothetical protein BC826DRAFT_1048442 [Russula brevipes]